MLETSEKNISIILYIFCVCYFWGYALPISLQVLNFMNSSEGPVSIIVLFFLLRKESAEMVCPVLPSPTICLLLITKLCMTYVHKLTFFFVNKRIA